MFLDIYGKCKCQKIPLLSHLNNSCVSYGHLKVANIFKALLRQQNNISNTKLLNLASALLKFLATARWQAILVVNFFTISVVGYYTICATTLNIKFSVVTLKMQAIQQWTERR